MDICEILQKISMGLPLKFYPIMDEIAMITRQNSTSFESCMQCLCACVRAGEARARAIGRLGVWALGRIGRTWAHLAHGARRARARLCVRAGGGRATGRGPSAPGASGEALAGLAEATCARKGTGGGSPRPRGLGWSSSGSLAANGVAEMTFFTISFFSSTKLAHVIVPKFNLGFLGPNPTGGTKFRVGNYFL